MTETYVPTPAPPPKRPVGHPKQDGYLFVVAVRVPTEADAERIKQLTAANRGAALLAAINKD